MVLGKHDMIPVGITRVVTAEPELGLGCIVVLEEIEGDRWFPIFIGYQEALAIDRQLMGVEPPRPLTHDLLVDVISEVGGDVERVEVTNLTDATYFAQIVVRLAANDTREIDSRPSDALAIAVRTGAQIVVEPDVFLRATE